MARHSVGKWRPHIFLEGSLTLFKFVASPIFAILAVAQAVRFFQGWPVTVDRFSVPLWASAVGAIAFATLAVVAWRENRHRRR